MIWKYTKNLGNVNTRSLQGQPRILRRSRRWILHEASLTYFPNEECNYYEMMTSYADPHFNLFTQAPT